MKTLLTILVSGLVLSVTAFAAEPVSSITAKEVKQLITTASTPADHLRLAKYFELRAAKLDAEAKEHAEMAHQYRARPSAAEIKEPGAAGTASHCEQLSQRLAQAANDARRLTADHEAMARQR